MSLSRRTPIYALFSWYLDTRCKQLWNIDKIKPEDLTSNTKVYQKIEDSLDILLEDFKASKQPLTIEAKAALIYKVAALQIKEQAEYDSKYKITFALKMREKPLLLPICRTAHLLLLQDLIETPGFADYEKALRDDIATLVEPSKVALGASNVSNELKALDSKRNQLNAKLEALNIDKLDKNAPKDLFNDEIKVRDPRHNEQSIDDFLLNYSRQVRTPENCSEVIDKEFIKPPKEAEPKITKEADFELETAKLLANSLKVPTAEVKLEATAPVIVAAPATASAPATVPAALATVSAGSTPEEEKNAALESPKEPAKTPVKEADVVVKTVVEKPKEPVKELLKDIVQRTPAAAPTAESSQAKMMRALIPKETAVPAEDVMKPKASPVRKAEKTERRVADEPAPAPAPTSIVIDLTRGRKRTVNLNSPPKAVEPPPSPPALGTRSRRKGHN